MHFISSAWNSLCGASDLYLAPQKKFHPNCKSLNSNLLKFNSNRLELEVLDRNSKNCEMFAGAWKNDKKNYGQNLEA